MNKETLARTRQFALYFTMAMAILLFANWALAGFKDILTGWQATVQMMLIWAVCIGGIMMGLLFVYALFSARHTK